MLNASRVSSFDVCLPKEGIGGVRLQNLPQRRSCQVAQVNRTNSDCHRDTKTKNGNSYAGLFQPRHKRQDPNPSGRSFSATHTTKVTSPPLLSIKSCIQNISYAKNCIPTIRVAPRNGCRLIRYRRPQAEVRRSAREGLEAASRQTEPGRDNRDKPQWPCLTPLRSEQGRLDLLSFDSNPEPNP